MIAEAEGPRLLPAPAPLPDPDLVDGTEWAGVDITGEVGGEAEVDSVDVVSSRLANLRLTDRRLDGLRMVDVLVEDCELSGVTMAAASLRRVELRRCRMSGLSAPNLRAQHVRFTDCRADGASFRMSAVNLRGAIAGDQALTLALRVFASMGIVVDDDYLARDDP